MMRDVEALKELVRWHRQCAAVAGRGKSFKRHSEGADAIERALSALTPQPDTGLRERVARLIEPVTFKAADHMWEYCLRSGDSPEFIYRCVVDSYGDRIAVAYEKADAIIAMLGGAESMGSSVERAEALPSLGLPAQHSAGWRLIESAPKDGSAVLAVSRGRVRIMFWRRGVSQRWGWHGASTVADEKAGQPAWWMPLPEPPADTAADLSPMKRHSPETPDDQNPLPQPVTGEER